MRVAVTGATGFVGRHALAELLARGFEVIALARDPARLKPQNGLTVVAGDLADLSALDRLCNDANAVLHIAGAISAATRAGFDAVNVKGTANLLAAAKKAGVSRFIHISSLAAREPTLSDYAASKAASEEEVMRQGTAFSTLILRPAAVYGEGDMATLPLIKALLARTAIIPGTSTGRFALIHVKDFANVCADAVTNELAGTIEVGDGGAYGWTDMAQAMRSVFGRPNRLIYIPQGLALFVGWMGDLFTRATGKPALVTSGKMNELYYPDWSIRKGTWPALQARSLAQGLASAVLWYQEKGLVPRMPRIDGKAS